jgi:hypothetical protein
MALARDSQNALAQSESHNFTVTALALQAGLTTEGQFELMCPAQNGQSYRIERSSNLTDWELVETVVAAGGMVHHTVDIEEGATWFYRIVVGAGE